MLARTGLMRDGGDADVRLPDHRHARRVRVRSGGASSAPRWCPPASSPGACGHEAHRRRLLRLLSRPDSPASCYLLEAEHDGRTWRVLLDLGSGALGALHRYADPLAIDAVFLSHLHADHCLDLCGYYVMRKYHPDGQQPRIPVWGPVGTADRMARAYDLPTDPGMTRSSTSAHYDGPVSSARSP